ncbi:helix-turn-helix domain-containing protein [Paenibacillus sp. 1P07SE]|uniref:helix-turn-helix domain-containing protein n=1 Tax=Paenibacillus sp. 1P07SE TaxID=3132209 RepID=UPI0039A5DF57
MVLLSTVPCMLIGVFLYLYGTTKIESALSDYHTHATDNAIKRIDSQLNHLEMIATLWSSNSPLSPSLNQIDLQRDNTLVNQIYESLTIIKSSDILIEEVYIYLEKHQALISDTYGIERLDETVNAAYRNLMFIKSPIYWTDTLPEGRLTNTLPLSLVVRLNLYNPNTSSFIIFRVKGSALHTLVGDANANPMASTLLLDQEGRIISGGHRTVEQLTALDNWLQSTTLQADNRNDSFIATWNNERYTIAAQPMKRVRETWVLAAATPFSEITSPLIVLSQNIIRISVLMLVLGLILSWIITRKIYQPVERLIRLISQNQEHQKMEDEFDHIAAAWRNISGRSETLQQRLHAQLPTLRESFLLQLVQGHLGSLSVSEIRERMDRYDFVHLKESGDIRLLVVELHGLLQSEGKFTAGDEQLISFAAANISKEWMSTRRDHAEVVNLHNQILCILLPGDQDSPHESKSMLYKMAKDLSSALHLYTKVNVTVAISKPVLSLGDIPAAFEEALKSLQLKEVHERLQVIDLEEVLTQGSHTVLYPFEEEKDLVQSLRMGRSSEEVDRQVDGFWTKLQEQATTELQLRQGCYQLFNTIQQTVIMSGFSPLQLYQGMIMNEQLSELKEPAHMIQWLKNDMIRPFLIELERTQNALMKQMVEDVLNTIHNNYHLDISLESCADLHGTYPRKLSAAFKTITGVTFLDYVTSYRLELTKTMLLQTEERINSIAEKVGYQPAYFHRLFKKHFGMTPGQYREQGKSDS